MKKINLIEWLWKTDSHEKLKVRGIQKYCILFLLLFTCVTHAYATDTPPTTKTVSNLIIFQSKTAARSAWMWKDKGNGTVRNFTVSSKEGDYYVSTYNNASNKYNKLIAFTGEGTDGSTDWPRSLARISGSSDVAAPSITSGENWYLKNASTNSQTPNPNKQFVHLSVSPSLSSSSVTTGTTVSVNYSSLTGDLSMSDYNKWNFFYSTDGGSTKTRFSTKDRTYATSGSDAPSFSPSVAGSYKVYAYLSDPWGLEVIVREMSLTVSDPTYTVTYHANGGSGTKPTDGSSPYTSGSTVTVLGKNTLYKTNYVFAGWNTENDGSGTYYAPGATFSITANKDLYAVWLDKAVLDGTNVMFYIEGYGGKNMNYLVNSSKTIVSTSYKVTDAVSYVNTAASNVKSYYYVSNNPDGSGGGDPWGGVSNTEIQDAQGGELFAATKASQSKTSAITASTSVLPNGDDLEIHTTCGSTTGVYGGRALYILYYLNSELIGVSLSSTPKIFVPASTSEQDMTYDISGLSDGDYTLYTILSDGWVYYIADHGDFKVGSAFHVLYNANGATGGSVPTDANDYDDGDEVTVATNSGDLYKTGYEFDGWYSNATGTDGTAYAVNSTFEIHSSTTLYAKWRELTYSVTVENGTPSSVPAGCATRPTITAATAPFGMAFDHWDVSGGASVASTTSSTTTVSATAAGTVTAVYTRSLYAFIEGRFHIASASTPRTWTNTFSDGDWDQSSTRIPFSYDATTHRFYLHTYATAKELTTEISSHNPCFFIKTSTASGSLTGVKSYKASAANTYLSAVGETNKQTLYNHDGDSDDNNANLRFNALSDDTYYVTIYFDGTYIWYEYMPAIINTIDLSPSRVPPLATIMATPSMYYKGHTDKAYCWGVYTDEDCTRQVSNVSFISLGDGTVQFAAPETRGTYYLKLTVRASDACDASIDAEKVVSFTVTTEDMVFFKNVPGWGNVHFYYLGKEYWNGSVDGDDGLGSGCNTSVDGGAARGMTRIGNSDIYYYDYSGNSTIKTHLASNPITYIAFTDNYKPTSDHFSSCQAIYRGDFSACAPMLVPENYITCRKNTSAGDGPAAYYQRGYWTNYMSESSGFTLYVWDVTSGSGNEITRNTMTGTAGNNTYTYTYNFKNDPQKHGLPYTYGFKFLGCGGSYYGASSTMDITNCTDWNLGTGTNNCGLSVTAQMEHTFILTLAGDGHVQVSVEYPVRVGDYRLLYDDETQDPQASQFIRQRANGKDTVAMYIRPTATEELKVQRCSGIDGETITWTDYDWKTGVDTIYVAGKPNGVYNFYLEQDASGNLTVNTSETKPYTGQYYIRTSVVDGGWNSYKSSADNLMTYAQYPDDRGYGFNYYKAKWVEATGSDVTYTIACDYSPALCKTLEGDPENNPLSAAEARSLPHSANIRFGWHSKTNQLKREYINGSSTPSDRYLVLHGEASKIADKNGAAFSVSGLDPNETTFTDLNNWIYRIDLKAKPNAGVKVTAKYDNDEQYFIGAADRFEEIIGGSAEKWWPLRVIYDFKTNRLLASWLADEDTEIDTDLAVKADVMIIRQEQDAAAQITFADGKMITDVKTVYGVLQLRKDYMTDNEKTIYERALYWISFPFDVKLSEVFGFGTYGTEWGIQYYDGAGRADKGFWSDSPSNWKFFTPTEVKNAILEKNVGYLLSVDVDLLGDPSNDVWANNVQQVSLYFPSKTEVSNITETTGSYVVPAHTCTITRDNRNIKDSHWNVIGVPSYHNVTFNDIPSSIVHTDDVYFYYAQNWTDNTLTPSEADDLTFKAMHSYMTQFHGTINWGEGTISTVVAARRKKTADDTHRLRLTITESDAEDIDDQTLVRLTDEATPEFDINKDLTKSMNNRKANVYTLIGDVEVGGNAMPLVTDGVTYIPVGVKVAHDGLYRFSLPDGTDGLEVYLLDQMNDTRTNMMLDDCETFIAEGTNNNRFVLEIGRNNSPTGVIETYEVAGEKVIKFLQDGQLFIQRGGAIHDARGNRVQ